MHETRNRSKLYPTPVLFVLRCNLEPVSNDDGDRAVCEHCLHRVVPPSSRGREATRTSSARANQRAQAHALISVPRRRGRYSPARRVSLGRFDPALRITNVGSDDSTIATPDSGERPLAARALEVSRARTCAPVEVLPGSAKRQQPEPSAHRGLAFVQVVTMLEGAPVVVRIPLGKGIASSRSAGGMHHAWARIAVPRARVSSASAR